MAMALVDGVFEDLPESLYISPDALHVTLQQFEGPLDFLLYLIRKQNIDILNIPITLVCDQYNRYIDEIIEKNIDLASEYLIMSVTLLNIKMRSLLPKSANDDEADEEQTDLVRDLLRYEQIKHAALDIDRLPRLNRDYFAPHPIDTSQLSLAIPPQLQVISLSSAMVRVLANRQAKRSMRIVFTKISIRQLMVDILQILDNDHSRVEFSTLLESLGKQHESWQQAIITAFQALLELNNRQIVSIRCGGERQLLIQKNEYQNEYH